MPGKFEILHDLAELAKAGYKPSDVKDIVESLKTDPDLDPKGGSDLKEDPEKSKKQPEKKDPENKEDSFDALAEIIKRESEG